MKSHVLLARLQSGKPLSIGEQTSLAWLLALPSIISQLITILMEYVDTAMVGQLGAQASASIGLITTTTWLMSGVCSALSSGFSVLVAHSVGAQNLERTRQILRQAIVFMLIVSCVIGLIGIIISSRLPHWLGGDSTVCGDATAYFFVYSLSMPLWAMNFLMAAMLRSSGNTRIPSVVNVLCCVLNIGFNYLLIFVFGLGVLGAAIGTACAITVSVIVLVVYVVFYSEELSLHNTSGTYRMQSEIIYPALHIGLPIALQQVVFTSAQIVSTLMIAPLGTRAIAAHSFGITIEGLCYMPGFGIGDSATTLIGQSVGAKRSELKRSFALITMGMGIGVMTVLGLFMFFGVSYLMPLMTPDLEVQAMTVEVLRIEAFAEPLYAASIVAYGIFVGLGDTKIPSLMNLMSIWLVRLPLAYFLINTFGLKGFWIAMCTELCFRGLIFSVRLMIKIRDNNESN